jgi:Tol biopolymer transport system component
MSPGKTPQIYMVSVDGGSPEQLTTGDRNWDFPNWSPDGNSLSFGEFESASAVYILDLRTRQSSKIPGSEGLDGGLWSRDGRYIAAYTPDNARLMVFDFKTHKWAEWAKGDFNCINWSRNGDYLYFDSTFGKDPAFYRLRVSDHKVERVASLKDLGRQVSGVFAVWTGLAPDDSPIALRDIGTQEIYALDWEAP